LVPSGCGCDDFVRVCLPAKWLWIDVVVCDVSVDGGLQIRYRRGRVEIVDRDGLEKRSCECYEVTRRKNEEIFSHRHN
jgi:hypothetical protein